MSKTYFKVTDGYMAVFFEDIKRAHAFIQRLREKDIWLKIQPTKMTEEQYNALPI